MMDTKKTKLVVIGNGMAGIRALEELLRLAPDMYDITVFGAEPYGNYNRILLSPVLAGEMTIKDIMLNDVDWYAQNGITLLLNRTVTQIDRVRRKVIAADGTEAGYDRLLLATGSNPFMLPVPGKDLPGVISYRDIRDTDEMIEAASRYRHAVVIGGGLLGLEAANGLRLRGMDVTVVHLMPWLMERQLDRTAAGLLQQSLEAKGLKFKLEKQTAELVAGESGRVSAIRFKDGETLPADLVVMAVGIRPNTGLAEAAGLHCNRGVEVNDTITVDVDVTFNPPEPLKAGMVVLDVAVPTGFESVRESIEEAVAGEPRMKRFDVAGRKVIFYIEDMDPGDSVSFSFDARALYPVKAKGVASQAYSYYKPEWRGETLGGEMEVR